MAHFAELDEDNIVIHLHVIGDDTPTSDGPLGNNDMHVDGETYCQNIFKTTHVYKQTSASGSFRGRLARKGDTYDAANDRFVGPKNFPSFVLNETTLIYEAPVAPPMGSGGDQSIMQYSSSVTTDENGDPLILFYDVKWDEDNVRWRGVKDVGSCYWDPNTSTWIEE
tara:strand:+ start:545 stop:1045 length:501 start_codon:yes stop_codon:yes gene_type:complete